MVMYDICSIRVGSTFPCLCQGKYNILAIEYWWKEHMYLILCTCNRVIGLDCMGFLKFIARRS